MATINTTPTIPTGIDILADQYVQDHASEIYPILSYVREHYGKFDFSQLSEAHKIATLTVVEHATRYGSFKTTFQLRHSLLGAMQNAERRLTCTDNGGPRPEHRAI